VRGVFRGCNARITKKLSNNPNLPEESLDLTWIEHFSQFSSPVTLSSNWTVKIESHYLGGLRHFQRWEIADVGVLLFVPHGGRIVRSKVALLQSKRLHPANNRVREEHRIDYEIGFARLADPEDLVRSIAVKAEFEFTPECQYGALVAGSDQVKAIRTYERENNLSVHYQLYNPWSLPFLQRVPISRYGPPSGEMTLGVRIMSARRVHELLAARVDGHRPTLKELHASPQPWPLEHFAADLFLGCKEGTLFDNIGDARIQNLFYRRTGPIAAAIAITIEGGG
jgi:hypothetical protein